MTDSFPPPGFVPGPSRVPGIEVYLPASTTEKRPDVMDFKCPRCGAVIAYSVEAGKLACEHCGYSEEVAPVHLGTTAESFEFKVETLQRSQQGWGTERKELACQSCGGAVSLPPDTLTYACPFCGSNKVLFREPLEDVLRPRYLIPFKIPPETCQAITRKWLGSSWMTPAGLKNLTVENPQAMGKFNPIYIPYWTFDATCQAAWKASVAHDVKEYVIENGVRKEVTRTVWRTESGKVQKTFQNLLVPGTTRLNMTALGRVDAFEMRDLILYEPRYLAGMQAQAYDLPLEEAWEGGRHILRERTRQACLDQASDSRVRNFRMTLDFSDEQWRYVLAPVYTSVYRYQEETFQILINGQTGRIAGPRPVDWIKFWTVIAAILAPGGLIALVGAFSAASEAGTMTVGLGMFLLVIGLVVTAFLFRQAQEMENV